MANSDKDSLFLELNLELATAVDLGNFDFGQVDSRGTTYDFGLGDGIVIDVVNIGQPLQAISAKPVTLATIKDGRVELTSVLADRRVAAGDIIALRLTGRVSVTFQRDEEPEQEQAEPEASAIDSEAAPE